jgi:hypothetical protein
MKTIGKTTTALLLTMIIGATVMAQDYKSKKIRTLKLLQEI